MPAPDREHAWAPGTLDEFVNQEDAKALIRVEIEAWNKFPGEVPVWNTLLFGPSGIGKSALAFATAHDLGVPVFSITCSEWASQTDTFRSLAALGQWRTDAVVLLDELDGADHRALYPLHSFLTSRTVYFGGEVFGFSRKLAVFATTNRLGSVPNAIKSRFILVGLEFYTAQDCAQIAMGTAHRINVGLSEGAARVIGENAGGEARKVVHLLRVLRNLVGPGQSAEEDAARKALALSGLRAAGLTNTQVAILAYLRDGPAGLGSLAALTALTPADVQEAEQFLIRRGFVRVSSKGRILTETGKAYLDREAA